MKRIGTVLAATVPLVAAITVAVPPAGASTMFQFQVRGVGTAYSSDPPALVPVSSAGQIAAWNQTVAYSARVINRSSTAQQFAIQITTPPIFDGLGTVDRAFYVGANKVPSDTYYTPMIAPGGNAAVTVKETVGQGVNAGLYITNLIAFPTAAPEEYRNGQLFLTNTTHPLVSNPFVQAKNGTTFVDGEHVPSHRQARVPSPALALNGATSFTVRVQNVAFAGPTPMRVYLSGMCGDFAFNARVGFTNITTQLSIDNYYALTLTQGQFRDIVITIKRVRTTHFCARNLANVQAYGEDQLLDEVYLFTPAAA